MLGFVGNLARKHGLAPKNDDKLRSHKPSTGYQNNDVLSHMQTGTIGNKWSYSTLEYPSDIQTRSDLSHYMMFYINVPNTTNFPVARTAGGTYGVGKTNTGSSGGGGLYGHVKARNEAQEALHNYTDHSEKSAGGSGSYGEDGKSWVPGQTNKVIARKHHEGTAAHQLGIKRTTRTNDSIVLYMPPVITNATMAAYKDSELGGLLGEGAGAVKNFMDTSASEGVMAGALGAVPNIANIMKTQIEKAGAAMASAAGLGDIKGAYDKLSNRAENNYLEAMFSGIGFRNFSWMWRFTPKNPKEAQEVDKIIRTFRFYMLPELPKDKRFGRYFVVPAEFDIFYMFRGEENSWLNKISTCVLKSCLVNYAPTQYQTFRPMQGRKGAPPIEIEMKLDFQETKLITKSDVMEGY